MFKQLFSHAGFRQAYRCRSADRSRQSRSAERSRRSLVALFVAATLLVSACAQPAPASQRILNVGMLLGTGGLGDRSFNDSAYAGLQEAQKKFNIRFETVTYTSEAANLDGLRQLLQQGYDLIIGIGFESASPIGTLAKEFPERKFAVVDTTVAGDNVTSIVYREQEGDFLMGVLAAMLTKSKKVGIIGGPMYPGMQRIISGFEQGAAYQDSSVAVVVDLASTYSDPQVGKALALVQYQAGVDVIHNACGRTGLGIIEAAKETGKLTTGTSGDQRYLAPDNVVGNRPKRVDAAVLMLVDEMLHADRKFQPGTRSLGLKEGGLALGPFNEKLVTAAMLKRLDELKQKIMAGEIVIRVPEN